MRSVEVMAFLSRINAYGRALPLLLFHCILLQSHTNNGVAASNILAVGDSMSSFMGRTLESFCGESQVTNAGIGGTTAVQWASSTAEDIVECGSGGWDVVYISVGGNDLLESGCRISLDELKGRMEDAISNIATNVAPGASNYVMTGYCMPYIPEDRDGGCSTPSDFATLSNAIRALSVENIQVPSGATLHIIDSLSACGGSPNSFSDETYFQDPIHLNAKGYCKVFSQSSVQSALTCRSSIFGFDCDSLDGTEIFGLDDNCSEGSGDSGDLRDSGDSSDASRIIFSAMTFLIVQCFLSCFLLYP